VRISTRGRAETRLKCGGRRPRSPASPEAASSSAMQVGQQHATTSNGTSRSLLGRCMAGRQKSFYFFFQPDWDWRRLRNRSKRGASSEAGTETAFAIVRNAGLPRKPRLSVEVCLLRFFSLLLLAQGTPAFFPPGLRQGQGKMADAGGCAGLEPTGSMHLSALRQDVSLFRHAASGIRVALCPVPGPLCKADIVIPTECSDNGGLPHCLEHLVFMGSQRFPSRGYLDKLANLCISQVPDTPHSH